MHYCWFFDIKLWRYWVWSVLRDSMISSDNYLWFETVRLLQKRYPSINYLRLSTEKLWVDSIQKVGIVNCIINGLLIMKKSVSSFQWTSGKKWIWCNLSVQYIIIDNGVLFLVVIFNYVTNVIIIKIVSWIFLLITISLQNHTFRMNKHTNYLQVLQIIN